MATAGYTFFVSWFVSILTCFHIHLLRNNKTTYEYLRGSNHFHTAGHDTGRGFAAIVETMCGPLPESQVRTWAERKMETRKPEQPVTSKTLTPREAASDADMRLFLGLEDEYDSDDEDDEEGEEEERGVVGKAHAAIDVEEVSGTVA